MVRAARALLGSVTRVLLLADIVVVKQLLLAKDRITRTLGRLESVATFTEFVKAFSVFGAEMVELAHITGDRQNDLKDERRRAQMTAARLVLERSTMMLLTSSKTSLRHPECTYSKENRDTVFCQMRRAMDLIHYVVKDGVLETSNERNVSRQQTIEWDSERATAFTCLKHFSRLVEMAPPRFDRAPNQAASSLPSSSSSTAQGTVNVNATNIDKDANIERRERERELMRSNSERDRSTNSHPREVPREANDLHRDVSLAKFSCRGEAAISIFLVDTREKLISALDKVCERIQDFTDSAYTTHEHRENILLLCDRAKLELNQLLRIAVNMEQHPNSSFDIDSCVDSVLNAAQDLINQLILTAQDQASDLPHMTKSGIELVNLLRNIALNHEIDRLQNSADRFHEHIDHMLEICKLLRHIAMTETLQVQAKFSEINVRIYGPQVITASKALCSYPSSKAMKENLEVFMDMWQWLITDISAISKDILDLAQAVLKPDKQGYLSLPRPGKHGTTSKPLKPSRLDTEEQEKIAKSGLEMKMVTNEMDAETDKWNSTMNDENNDIVKRAKNMSAMAFSMYQFTKGEGSLRTTQDLFTQAEYFAEEANRLYKVVRQFSYQVPAGPPKKELLDQLDKVPTYVQTLQFTVKEPTVGKSATFVKVDHVIQETKNLMNIISKVVSTCFDCANKYKLDFSGLSGRSTSGNARDEEGNSGMQGSDSKGSATSEGSM
ncbi:CLUMA_CG000677, isoform A [Clunio marinus]|nr:CLUMA_CG000677, isoform A [Clunio marinus]